MGMEVALVYFKVVLRVIDDVISIQFNYDVTSMLMLRSRELLNLLQESCLNLFEFSF